MGSGYTFPGVMGIGYAYCARYGRTHSYPACASCDRSGDSTASRPIVRLLYLIVFI